MKGFISVSFVLVMQLVLVGCATNGDKASYEGYSMANEANPASESAATMVAPLTTRIPPR